MFGRDSDWWNHANMIALIAAGIVALVIAYISYVIITVQKREAVVADQKAAAEEQKFELYKLDVAVKVAAAEQVGVEAGQKAGNALVRAATLEKEAAEARLETQRLKAQLAWRRVSSEQHDSLVKALVGHRFSMYFEYSQSDPEATLYAQDIFESLKHASGIEVYPPHPLVLPPAPPGITVSGTNNKDRDALKSALSLAGIKFRVDDNMPAGAPRISIGSRPPPF